MFESGYRLRGFTNFLADLVRNKPLAHYLLDQLTALMLHSALILARAGVDILLLDDDVAMPTGLIIGPATWREFFKPRLADVIRLAREVQPELIVFYHSDGDFTPLVADLVEIGVNVINPLQPDCMDALAIKERFGDRLALWGTVGSAALWDHGTPAQIRAEVKHRIETLGPAGPASVAGLRSRLRAVREHRRLRRCGQGVRTYGRHPGLSGHPASRRRAPKIIRTPSTPVL